MPTEVATPVFDRDAVLDMVDGEIEFLHELIEMFLDDLPNYRDSLKSAIDDDDPATLQQTAHRMKSSVGNLGGREAQAAVIDLEKIARAGDLTNAPELLESCNEKLDRFSAVLNSVLEEV